MDVASESELLASTDDRAMAGASISGASTSSADDVEPAAFVQICNFADASLHAQVLDLALRNQAAFSASGVVTSDKDYRRSRVLFDLEECGPRMSAELHKILPWVYQRLGITTSAEGRLEMQMTAHNDGDYFRLHNDNGSPDTADRVLSYVYYCNLPPKRFSGGALRLYDSRVENGYWVGADTFHMVEPIDNSIVFFLSRLVHEVMPIECASRSFCDSRFTMNGWVRGI